MKIKLTINIKDLAAMLLIVVTFAFHDYSLIMAGIQVFCSIIIYIMQFKERKIHIDKIKYLIWFGFFDFWAFLSLFWATNSINNVLITVRSLIQETMVGFSIILYIREKDDLGKVLKYITIGSIILIVRMLIQVPVNAWGTERVGNYIGYGNNGASLVLTYAALILFHYFQETKKKKNLLLFIIFLAFSFLCGSKKALLITIIGVSLLMLLKSKNMLQSIKKLIEVMIIVAILFYLVMNIEQLYNVLGNRIEKMFFALTNQNGGDMSTMDRMDFAKSAYEVFKKHPIFGIGLDNYRYYNSMMYYAHNNYLEITADLGIIGLILYYIMPFNLLIRSFVKKENRNLLLVNVLMFAILIADVAAISFEVDSTQLYIAVIYSIYILNIKEENMKIKEKIYK